MGPSVTNNGDTQAPLEPSISRKKKRKRKSLVANEEDTATPLEEISPDQIQNDSVQPKKKKKRKHVLEESEGQPESLAKATKDHTQGIATTTETDLALSVEQNTAAAADPAKKRRKKADKEVLSAGNSSGVNGKIKSSKGKQKGKEKSKGTADFAPGPPSASKAGHQDSVFDYDDAVSELPPPLSSQRIAGQGEDDVDDATLQYGIPTSPVTSDRKQPSNAADGTRVPRSTLFLPEEDDESAPRSGLSYASTSAHLPTPLLTKEVAKKRGRPKKTAGPLPSLASASSAEQEDNLPKGDKRMKIGTRPQPGLAPSNNTKENQEILATRWLNSKDLSDFIESQGISNTVV